MWRLQRIAVVAENFFARLGSALDQSLTTPFGTKSSIQSTCMSVALSNEASTIIARARRPDPEA
jgi:hypothetical protein